MEKQEACQEGAPTHATRHASEGQWRRKRRRLHGRGMASYLANLTDEQFEEILSGRGGTGRGRGSRRSSGEGAGQPDAAERAASSAAAATARSPFSEIAPAMGWGRGLGASEGAHLTFAEYHDLATFEQREQLFVVSKLSLLHKTASRNTRGGLSRI